MTESLTLFIASDHAGFSMKAQLCDWFKEKNLVWTDLGTHTGESVDYPDIAHTLATTMKSYPKSFGILICGSGIGVSIAVNRYSHVRAALVNEPVSAKLARHHNDANVLCLSGRLMGIDMAKECISTFLYEPFEGGRHERRIQKLG